MAPVTVHFEGDGWDKFALVLDRFSDNIGNARPVFDAMADEFGLSMRAQFSQQGAHTGAKWAPLSPAYAAWKSKRYPGKPIMELTGDLKKSLTNRSFGVERITNLGMTVGTDIPYAIYHQRDTPIMPKRELIGPPPMMRQKKYAKILQGWIVRRDVMV